MAVQTIQELIASARNVTGIDMGELDLVESLIGKMKEERLRMNVADLVKEANKNAKEIDHIAVVMGRVMIPAVMNGEEIVNPAVTLGNRMTDCQIILNQLYTEISAYNESANTAIKAVLDDQGRLILTLKTRKNPDQIERSWSELASAMSRDKITHVYILDNKSAKPNTKATRAKFAWQSTASQGIEIKAYGNWLSPSAAGKLITTWASFNPWANVFVLDSEGNPTVSVEDYLTEYRKRPTPATPESAPTPESNA